MRWLKARPSSPSCSAPSPAASRRKTAAIRPIFSALVLAFAVLCWLCGLFIPTHRRRRAALVVVKNIAASTWSLIQHLRQRCALVVGRAGDELVLAGRRGRAVAVAAMVKELLGGDEEVGHRLSRDLFHRGRGRLRPCRLALRAGRIVLLPTLIGGVLSRRFLSLSRLHPSMAERRPRQSFWGRTEVFVTSRGIKMSRSG